MDRNTITGLLALVAFVIMWAVFFSNPDPEKQTQNNTPKTADTTKTAQQSPKAAPDSLKPGEANGKTAEAAIADGNAATPDSSLSDSARQTRALKKDFGPFAKLAARGKKGKLITVNTDLAIFKINPAGAQLHSVVLKDYKTADGQPLDLWPEGQQRGMNYTFIHRDLKGEGTYRIETEKLFFEPVDSKTSYTVSGEQTQTVKLRATVAKGKYIEQQFTFKGDKFDLDHQLVFNGMGSYLSDRLVTFNAMLDVPQTEKSRDAMLQKTTVYYKTDGDVEELGMATDDIEREKLELGAEWYSFKMQFFDIFFIADKSFDNGIVSAAPLPQKKGVRRLAVSSDYEVSGGPTDKIAMQMYFGPAEYNTLAAYERGFAKTIDMGWGPIRWITIGIQSVFRVLENVISNYGIIILILAIAVKTLLWPLTQKMLKGQAKMMYVNKLPEIKELDEQYKDEPQKLQQAKMKIYTKLGVSPFSGCLPMLLQFPVLIAMFVFFPNSIELRQEGFLWAEDLSTYDAFITFDSNIWLIGDHLSLFTLLWVVSQLLYTIIQQKTGQMQMGAGQQAKFMKYFPYIMPLIFFTIFNSYSSGLSYYYLVFNLITIGQTYFIKYVLIDDKKIRAQIDDVRSGKAAPAKKGGIGGWMARQQEKQQELMEERKAQMQGRSGRRQHQQHQQKKKKRRK